VTTAEEKEESSIKNKDKRPEGHETKIRTNNCTRILAKIKSSGKMYEDRNAEELDKVEKKRIL